MKIITYVAYIITFCTLDFAIYAILSLKVDTIFMLIPSMISSLWICNRLYEINDLVNKDKQ